jgi:NAD+ synthase
MLDQQIRIAQDLGVARSFDVEAEIARRITFLCDYLSAARAFTYVLGISGGVDSLTAGLLAQAAVKKLRGAGYDATFVAMRLPYGLQRDEGDAQRALSVIGPDRIVTVDIKPAADAMLAAILRDASDVLADPRRDFHHGNVKARQRMIAQFAVAGALKGLVIGTDHAAEALMGFFTKFGDGAADVVPLTGLTKRRVRAIARHFGAPPDLIFKTPTADLETEAPLKPDEEALGVTYEDIDDFLEGKDVPPAARQRILSTYLGTAHKRALPIAPD